MKIFITLLFTAYLSNTYGQLLTFNQTIKPMRLTPGTAAPDFGATTIDGTTFTLSSCKGKRILLSFYRNGACALCNLRIHELISRYERLDSMGLKVIAVFESSIEDMVPYVGKQNVPFVLMSDPGGILYDLYKVESSEEKINAVLQSGVAKDRIAEAANNGFVLTPQEGANFFRLPADFLIDEDFVIQKVHYSNEIIDHFSIGDIEQFAKSGK